MAKNLPKCKTVTFSHESVLLFNTTTQLEGDSTSLHMNDNTESIPIQQDAKKANRGIKC